MKKLLSTFSAIVASAGFAFSQCTIDPNNTQFFSPGPDSIPCVERGNAYDQVIQIAVPEQFDLQELGAPFPYLLYIDSVVINSVNGFPTGITNQLNAVNGTTLYGGENYCTRVSGTTNDAVGRYELLFEGTITMHGNPFPPFFDGDTTVDLATVQSQPDNPFRLFLDVINVGDECRPSTGINDFSSELNAVFFVYPNPNNGTFEVKLNAGHRVNGEINVVDNTGRSVYTQKLDVVGLYNTTINLSNFATGLYSVQIKSENGFASKIISIQ